MPTTLDKIRAEFKSDTESAVQSEAGASFGTNSSPGLIITSGGAEDSQHPAGTTYRRASQIAIDISIEDLRAETQGLRGRLALALSRFFGRPKSNRQQGSTNPQSKVPVDAVATTSTDRKQSAPSKKPLSKASGSASKPEKEIPKNKKKENKSSKDKPIAAEGVVKLSVENETKKSKEKPPKTKSKKATIPGPKESTDKSNKKTKPNPVPTSTKPSKSESKKPKEKPKKSKPEKSKSKK